MPTISYSELNTYSNCRQQWKYIYLDGLRSKIDSEPLSIGSAGHTCLEAYYKGEDWRKALYEWRDNALSRCISEPEVLPENELEDEEQFEVATFDLSEIVNRIEQIMDRYILKWGEEDKQWEIFAVEEWFEIPIPETEYILVGKWDLILKDNSDRIWLLDSKFPKKTFRDYESLELDDQVGIYQWAAIQKGYDALGFIYNQILAKLPDVPKQNKTKNKFGGYTSIAEISTEWETYRLAVIGNGEEHLLEQYEMEMVPKLAEKVFFDRKYLYRNETEIESFSQDLLSRIRDFSSSQENIYRQPDKFKCKYCSVREVCKGDLRGDDMSGYIEMHFDKKEKK